MCVFLTCFSRFHSSSRPQVRSSHRHKLSLATWTRTFWHFSTSSSHRSSTETKQGKKKKTHTQSLKEAAAVRLSSRFPRPYQSVQTGPGSGGGSGIGTVRAEASVEAGIFDGALRSAHAWFGLPASLENLSIRVALTSRNGAGCALFRML